MKTVVKSENINLHRKRPASVALQESYNPKLAWSSVTSSQLGKSTIKQEEETTPMMNSITERTDNNNNNAPAVEEEVRSVC